METVGAMPTRPGFVWLEYPDTGGKAEFNEEAAPMWQGRGWQPCDPPNEPDLTKDPVPDDQAPSDEAGSSQITATDDAVTDDVAVPVDDTQGSPNG